MKSSIMSNRNTNSQTPIRYFYNEISLLDSTSLTDLINLYRPKIEWFDETYNINISYKYFKIWNSEKTVDFVQRNIEKENKESLLARYLIALGAENFTHSDIFELFYLTTTDFYGENLPFKDGLKFIHKMILFGNVDLFRNLLKLGYELNLYTEKGEKFLPCSFP